MHAADAGLDATLERALREAAQGSGELFALLRAPWPEGGVERDTFGAGEQHAHDLLLARGRALGLESSVDFAGNLWLTLPGRDRGAPVWVTGSHLDSVPQGGNYDGAAGVVAGLAVLQALHACGRQPLRDIVLAAFRAEEASSWYRGDFHSHVGSRAALGMLDPAELRSAQHLRDGRSLHDCMVSAGARPQEIRLGHRAIDPSRCHGFLELHIEQGPVLVERGLPVGVVTGIRGSARPRSHHPRRRCAQRRGAARIPARRRAGWRRVLPPDGPGLDARARRGWRPMRKGIRSPRCRGGWTFPSTCAARTPRRWSAW